MHCVSSDKASKKTANAVSLKLSPRGAQESNAEGTLLTAGGDSRCEGGIAESEMANLVTCVLYANCLLQLRVKNKSTF